MVLVQTYDHHTKHVIYYLSKGLVGVELRYPYIEKLALEATYAIQCFFHYSILQTTIVVSEENPIQYILSWQILWGRYSKWIVILQEFDLEFTTANQRNP